MLCCEGRLSKRVGVVLSSEGGLRPCTVISLLLSGRCLEVSYQGTKASFLGIAKIKLLPFSFCQIPALTMLIWPSEMYFQLNHQGLGFRVFEVTCGK